VLWNALSRCEPLAIEDARIVLYQQVVHHVQVQRNLRVVFVVDTQRHRRAVLLSTDVDLDALTVYRYYTARCQIIYWPA
jgi:hypothetical protein